METYREVSELYVARGDDVNELRPIFSGDVFADVAIAGIQGHGMAVLVAHPCSIRGANAQLRDHMMAAAVLESAENVGPGAWRRGRYDQTPLPGLLGAGLYIGHFDQMGVALTQDLQASRRLACLSVFGVNLMQQRLIMNLTRFEVPTSKLLEAFAHTFEEADILEDWNDVVCAAGISQADSAALFEAYVTRDLGGGRTLQSDLRDSQWRSAVRRACRAEAIKIASDAGSIEP
jgi:hypothetical protein